MDSAQPSPRGRPPGDVRARRREHRPSARLLPVSHPAVRWAARHPGAETMRPPGPPSPGSDPPVARAPPRSGVPARHRGAARDRRHRRGGVPRPVVRPARGVRRSRRVLRRLRLPDHPPDPRRAGEDGAALARVVLGSAGPPAAGRLGTRRRRHRARRAPPAAAAHPALRRHRRGRGGDVHVQLRVRRPAGELLRRPARPVHARRPCCTSGRSPSRSSSTSAGRRCSSCSPAVPGSIAGCCWRPSERSASSASCWPRG